MIRSLLTVAALATAGTATVTSAASAAPAKPPRVPKTQLLAVLEASHTVYAKPNVHAKHVETVARARPITGETTTLPVLASRKGWLDVLLPGRPNSHSGWIAAKATHAAQTSWALRVTTSTLHVQVFDRGKLVRTFVAIVGAPSTPTPVGRFFVEETVKLGGKLVGAPFALALSARSDVFQEFDGGPGQIALHGLGNIGGVLGTPVSHGCVRLDAGSIEWLAARISPGVPVTITR